MFNEQSGLVGIWCHFVKAHPDQREQVPNLSNLREMVFRKLEQETDRKTQAED